MTLLQKMLAEIRKRQAANFAFRSQGGGMSLASNYAKGWHERTELAELLKNDTAMAAAIKHAENTLTWCDEKFVPQLGETVDGSAALKAFHMPDGVEVPKNTLMVFRNVITTNDEDRDGDVLHTKGAKIDTPMPLLWQHMSNMPIGKMLAIDKHDEKMLRVFTALLDLNDLTEDTAKLIEAGALRISHGFIPLKYDDREEESRNVPWKGFNVWEYEVMEESVVSTPSNRRCIIDMYSRDDFKSAPVKRIGKQLFDDRDSKHWGGFVFEELKSTPAEPPVVPPVEPKGIVPAADPDITATPAVQRETITVTRSKTDDDSDQRIMLSFNTDENVEAKLVALGLIKGGRELSKANLSLLREVVADLEELKTAEGLTRSQQALLNKSVGNLTSLIDKNTDQADPDDDKTAADKTPAPAATEPPAAPAPEPVTARSCLAYLVTKATAAELAQFADAMADMQDIEKSHTVGKQIRQLVGRG